MLVVFTNAAEGRDEEFNRWYNDVHLGDVLGVEGFVAAQRFELEEMGGGKPAHRYLALYEIETDDVGAVVERLTSSAGTMVMSDALLDPSALIATPITKRRT
jgi:hypothetical protein